MRTNRLIAGGVAACLAALACAPAVQAQVDLTGNWNIWIDQDHLFRGAGPDPDAYFGMPFNAEARAAAVATPGETISMLDRQCAPWSIHYMLSGPFGLEMWPTRRIDGSILAWNIQGSGDRWATTIWMDGRPQPSPEAENTPAGFTTGRWMGDTLVTTTTHISDGAMARNWAPNSKQEVLEMMFTRYGDKFLNITGIVHDPVYLDEPWILSQVASLNGPAAGGGPGADPTCQPEEEVVSDDKDRVPTYLEAVPATANYATEHYGIPREAELGGAETMYPEYTKKVQPLYKRPQGYCTLDCCGYQLSGAPPGQAMNYNVTVLKCKQDNP
jgi:hypothetical protein